MLKSALIDVCMSISVMMHNQDKEVYRMSVSFSCGGRVAVRGSQTSCVCTARACRCAGSLCFRCLCAVGHSPIEEGRKGFLCVLLTGEIVAVLGSTCRSRVKMRDHAAAFSVRGAQCLYSSGRKIEWEEEKKKVYLRECKF